MSRGLYVVRTRSEYEKKVKQAIEKTIETLGLNNKIFQVIVPCEKVIEYKANKKYVRERPYFTGYVFLDMELNQETYWAIRNTPGVAGFLGGTQPTVLAEEEARNLFELIERPTEVKPKPAVSFEKDETVRITDGPFKHFHGTIEEINEERGKLKIMVAIFGRLTPVELDFSQVEKL